jgi:aspartate/methionine/tyrosine aminotransferase
MLLEELEGSPTREMSNLIQRKTSHGDKVISLALGEPSSNTPREIIDAAYDSMISGDVHYVSTYGIPEVREAILAKVRRKNDITAELPNTIFCTTKYSVYASIAAVSNDRFEVMVPDPGYFYSQPVILSGGTPIQYKLGADFSLDVDAIKKGATERTRAIVINTPGNPTGKVFSANELRQLYDFCSANEILIISDEAYEDLVYGKKHFSVGSLEKSPEHVVTLFSLSKSYAMTGWRAGYIVANEKVISLVVRLLENTTTCFPPFIQKASAFALNKCEGRIQEFRAELEERKKITEEEIGKVDALELTPIEGAFYAFPSYKNQLSSREMCMRLLEKHNVAVVSGASFGGSGERHLRISFAGLPDTITKGMEEIGKFFDGLAC